MADTRRPVARASAIASTSAGWSLPRFAKMQATPASARASRSALLVVYIGSLQWVLTLGFERDCELAQQLHQLDLRLGADDLVQACIVAFRARGEDGELPF